MRVRLSNDGGLEWRLNRREFGWLREALSVYPLTPPGHHKISHRPKSQSTTESQRLLDEALEMSREANRRSIASWLAQGGALDAAAAGKPLRIRADDIERFLQVVNDVRVGAWVQLGSPEELPSLRRLLRLSPEEARRVWLMEFCGLIQVLALRALDAGK